MLAYAAAAMVFSPYPIETHDDRGGIFDAEMSGFSGKACAFIQQS